MTLPLFPLGTVLFPGGALPLKVFEQRYLDMVARCLKEGSGFGVCLIRDGAEVGAAALPEMVGCHAAITDWDMPRLGVLHITARGTRRFRVVEHTTRPDGLVVGQVEDLPDDERTPIPPELEWCAAFLGEAAKRLSREEQLAAADWGNAAWVAWRLAEMLPFEPDFRQGLLVEDSPVRRLSMIAAFLKARGVVPA